MAKFILVDQAPADLKEDEIVISMPTFAEEIAKSDRFASKLGKRKVTQLFHLKNIANNIGQEYDPEGFDPIATIPYSRYEGIEFTSPEDLSQKVILKMFNRHYPQIVDKYLDKCIKARPAGTKTVYFVGNEDHIKPFIDNGLDPSRSQKKVVETD